MWFQVTNTDRGTMFYHNGDMYEGAGQMINAKVRAFTWKNSSKYSGAWKGDREEQRRKTHLERWLQITPETGKTTRDGKGYFEYANGDKYVGDWVEWSSTHGKVFRFHGRPLQGLICWVNAPVQVFYYHANGDKVCGQLQEGMQDGKGTFTWANGAVYEGDWKDNKRNGFGRYKWNNGDVYGGWVEG